MRNETHSFEQALLDEVFLHLNNHHEDNFEPIMKYDAHYREQPTKTNILTRFLDKKIPVNYQLNLKRTLFNALDPEQFYRTQIKTFKEMHFLYHLLNDHASRSLLLKLIAYKILGYKKVKLPRNNAQYWRDIQEIEKLVLADNHLPIHFANLNLPFIDLNPIGYDLKLNVTPAGAAAIFSQKQYEYHTAEVRIKAGQNECVLDCGACWGETSLYFAREVGHQGKVFSFEFIPNNLDIFNINLNHNPHLKNNIHLIPEAVWHTSDEDLAYSDHGPGSSIHQQGVHRCKTLSIDDLVERQHIPQVHFIKMDIEGSELNALKGAEKTLRRDRPKLAISVYHKPDDFITIPHYLHGLNLGYQFYLDHHTIHNWETVLFSVSDS